MRRAAVTFVCLWALGCALTDPRREDDGVRVCRESQFRFSAHTVRRDGDGVSFTAQVVRPPGCDEVWWGGRIFLTVCCYDATGTRLTCDDQGWLMFSWDELKEHGQVEAEFHFTPPKGATAFTVELPGCGKTPPLGLPIPVSVSAPGLGYVMRDDEKGVVAVASKRHRAEALELIGKHLGSDYVIVNEESKNSKYYLFYYRRELKDQNPTWRPVWCGTESEAKSPGWVKGGVS